MTVQAICNRGETPARYVSSAYRHMLPTNDPHPILAEIESFIAATRMAETTFGRLAIGDNTIVEELRRGRDVRRRTASRLRVFMQQYAA